MKILKGTITITLVFLLLYILFPTFKYWFIIEIDFDTVYQQANMSNIYSKRHFSYLQSTHQCSQHSVEILILVTSHTSNFIRRERIRKSWGKMDIDSNKFRTFFVVGKVDDTKTMRKLNEEETKYHDLVRGDFIENLHNLSRKLQVGFEWSEKYCRYAYLLKADDDVFINSKLVYDTLANGYKVLSNTKLFIGHAQRNQHALRSGKYKIGYNVYRKSHYPPFCSGGAFILSTAAVKAMIPFMNKSVYFQIDDVYIGFLAYNAKINPINDIIFDKFKSASEIDCQFKSHYGVFHPVKTDDCFRKLYDGMLSEFSMK